MNTSLKSAVGFLLKQGFIKQISDYKSRMTKMSFKIKGGRSIDEQKKPVNC